MPLTEKVLDRLKEATNFLMWDDPTIVGTARITTIVHPYRDMVFFTASATDNPSRNEFVFTPPGAFQNMQIVEVWVQTPRVGSNDFGLPREVPKRCRVAIKPFTNSKPTSAELDSMAIMLRDPANVKDIFTSRSFFLRFFDTTKDLIRPMRWKDIV